MVRHLDWRESWSHVYSFARLLNLRIAGRFNRRVASSNAGKSANAGRVNNRMGVALWQYTPESCPVPMVHFIAADQPVSRVLDDPRYGWRDFARSGIEFQSVPGDHDSMFQPENAPQLAHCVGACLDSLFLAASGTT
jgi:hypothetical protein